METEDKLSKREQLAVTLALYSRAHRWLIIPIVVTLIAFTPFYFSSFPTEPWAYHIHALSAVAWYVLMVVQPYLATHYRLKDHRTWGMLGLLIAGSFISSGLLITPTNVYFGSIGGFPPKFSAGFFYGLTLTETLAMVGFAGAVIMAIRKSKIPDEHAVWMLGTVFFGFMPAWLRISIVPIMIFDLNLSMTMMFLLSLPFVAVILFTGWKIGKPRHPAIILSVMCTLLMSTTTFVGELAWYQDFITGLMKPMVPWPESVPAN